MAYLLRFLLVVMLASIAITCATAFHWITPGFSHILVSIPTFLGVIFIQAFVMFYFIGIARLVENVYRVLASEKSLGELFENPPEDLGPYQKKVNQFLYAANLAKRQTIPWTMLMLLLGMGAFLLGGAHDTGLVSKPVHVGLVYGFLAAMLIGVFRQWYYLGKGQETLKELKTLFDMPRNQM